MARQTIDVGVSGDPASGELLRNALIKINDMTSEIYPPLTDTRTPTDASVTNAKVAASAAIAESKLALAADASAGTPSRRTIGAGALQATAGNDTRLSDARAPTAHNHSGVDITSGTVNVLRIGTGTKDTTTFYRGDGAFAVPAGGGGTATTVSGNRGNVSVTLTSASETVQVFATALTAERFVTLPEFTSSDAGRSFVILRRPAATGTFPLTVRDSALAVVHRLLAADSWVEAYWSGSIWVIRHSDDESLDASYVLRAGDTGIGRLRGTAVAPLSEDELVTKNYADSVVGSQHVSAYYLATSTFWFLGKLRVSSATVFDKLFLSVQGGAPWDSGQAMQDIIAYNQSATELIATVDRRGWTFDPVGRWAVRAYRQADNSLDFYAFVLANEPGTLRLGGILQKQDAGVAVVSRVVPGTPSTTTPAGTLAFDSRTWETPTQGLAAATRIFPRGARTVPISSTAAITLTNALIMPAGQPDETKVLRNVGSFAITFTNGNGVRFISGANLALAAGASLTMQFSGAHNEWRQLHPVGI